MSCKWGSDDWQNYVNNTVVPKVKEEMDQHLAACAACMERLELAVIESLPALEERFGPPPDVTEHIMQNITPRPKAAPRKKRHLTSFAHYGIAASIALVLMGSGFFDHITAVASQSGAVTEHSDQLLDQAVKTANDWLGTFKNWIHNN
jgi:anti-sigma factor RsiW